MTDFPKCAACGGLVLSTGVCSVCHVGPGRAPIAYESQLIEAGPGYRQWVGVRLIHSAEHLMEELREKETG